jgi:glycine cleavage system H lipoate-binding protein
MCWVLIRTNFPAEELAFKLPLKFNQDETPRSLESAGIGEEIYSVCNGNVVELNITFNSTIEIGNY